MNYPVLLYMVVWTCFIVMSWWVHSNDSVGRSDFTWTMDIGWFEFIVQRWWQKLRYHCDSIQRATRMIEVSLYFVLDLLPTSPWVVCRMLHLNSGICFHMFEQTNQMDYFSWEAYFWTTSCAINFLSWIHPFFLIVSSLSDVLTLLDRWCTFCYRTHIILVCVCVCVSLCWMIF